MEDFKTYSKKQLVDLLSQNDVSDVCEIYVSGDELVVISQFPNGNFYHYYNAQDKDKVDMGGPYKDLKEAKLYLNFKYPDAELLSITDSDSEEPKITEKEDKTIYEWRLPFYLSLPIEESNFDDAHNYLIEENMLKYYDGKGKARLRSIYWVLTSCIGGYIRIKGQLPYISRELKNKLTEFIIGQNSDGLGEGFSQQDFALVTVKSENEEDDEELYEFSTIYIDEEPEFEKIIYI